MKPVSVKSEPETTISDLSSSNARLRRGGEEMLALHFKNRAIFIKGNYETANQMEEEIFETLPKK